MIKMKLAGMIQKEQRKKEGKRKREKMIQTILYTVIGIPYAKIEKCYLEIQQKRWKKDEEKSKQKVIHEIVHYIKKELALERIESYFIYNAWRNDDIDYGNALCLHYFEYEKRKYTKNMRIFKRIFMNGNNSQNYYRLFYEAIQEHFTHYEDVVVTTGIEKHWSREYEYIKLTLKTKKAS